MSTERKMRIKLGIAQQWLYEIPDQPGRWMHFTRMGDKQHQAEEQLLAKFPDVTDIEIVDPESPVFYRVRVEGPYPKVSRMYVGEVGGRFCAHGVSLWVDCEDCAKAVAAADRP